MNGQPLRYLSLFSGIGGFDLGFDRAGMVCAGQVEFDEKARAVLAKHWPDVPRMTDVREVQGHEFGTVDVICGGFPCQPHSIAGKRRGAADDRNLWPEYRRIVESARPRWVVGENVPGLAHTMLDAIISDLENLHYEVVTFDIPAIAFDARHIRRRLFIVAHYEGVPIRPGFRPAESAGERRRRPGNGSSAVGVVPNADRAGRQKQRRPITTSAEHAATERHSKWPPEPGVGRVAYGVSSRVDRLGALGNAIVPQVAEWLGRRIIAANNGEYHD